MGMGMRGVRRGDGNSSSVHFTAELFLGGGREWRGRGKRKIEVLAR